MFIIGQISARSGLILFLFVLPFFVFVFRWHGTDDDDFICCGFEELKIEDKAKITAEVNNECWKVVVCGILMTTFPRIDTEVLNFGSVCATVWRLRVRNE